MKLVNETVFASTVAFGLTYVLYTYMGLHRRINTIEKDINLIMSTHLLYMETRDIHTKQIKSITDRLDKTREIKFYDDE